MDSVTDPVLQRQRILIQGIVQGVGFRPFIYGQALHYGLVGFVFNDSQGVTIEVEGSLLALASFQRALREELPPLARIDSIATESVQPCHETTFVIAHSQASNQRYALISPDTATCDDCLRELFDPADRRYGYPFINCTNCGPRFTIVQDVPYDRDKTTMRTFPMCPTCLVEYEDSLNRRFHAQPNACPLCGPQVSFYDGGTTISTTTTNDLIMRIVQQLAAGAILAIKGLGGYHLACDALNTEAVQQLRQRKHREAKPFALMVPDLNTARQLCVVSAAEATLLQSHRRPIVLLRQLPNCPVASGVSPAYNTLGIMLPYTPLHHLLLRAFTTALAPGSLAVLVMTSGNLSDEPIAYQDDDARTRLAPIVDGMLTSNRDIYMRCDDSVMHISAGNVQFLRRSRGYAPEPIPLSFDLPLPLLACGGHLKNTFCLGKGRRAFVSHHIGDLENLETLTSFKEGIKHFQNLFDIDPQAIVYDLHPEYLATKYALDSAIPQKIGIQHHHAHIASVLAEHGLQEPVIGVAADGTGYGTDGAVWGCEIMTANLLGFERLAYLTYIPLIGGEQAIRQPWRMAAAYLAHVYGSAFLEVAIPFTQQLDRAKWHILAQMMSSHLNSPPTSSLGRLFDAVAALLGLPQGLAQSNVLYEGQAAVELEMQATYATDAMQEETELYPFLMDRIEGQMTTVLNVAPLIRAIVNDIQQGRTVPKIAYRFHCTIAELLAQACHEIRKQTGLSSVALSGGVFQNRLLLEQLITRLEAFSFQVYTNRRVPPNDGGLSLGQLAIAAAQLRAI
ncbi:carbamoyltransferase HypF [Dictyobacter arantiisoli]|uniref:Carbamoyltransferase n=1 Tax=Dictyobacter arantiisoli TaxID=2014874 RepID=A0A5A5TGC5_9CHLR|nr:carbamoyltransferase HypF [Dictyobacter arantiisoli]GCF09974.1 carbamoyltransferase [Dictyobacter arantiisoli]